MPSSHFQQTISFQPSRYDCELPYQLGASDAVHHESRPHYFLPPYQYQEDSFTETLDSEARVSRFSFTLPYDFLPWNSRVDRLSTPEYEPPSFHNHYLASPTSSITLPSLPTTPPSLPNAGQFQFTSQWSQGGPTAPMGGFPSQEAIHQEQLSVYDTSSGIWDGNYLVSDQMATVHERVHRYTSCFESPSLESYAAESMSPPVSNKKVTPHLDTSPVGSKRTRTPPDLSDERQLKRIRRVPDALLDGLSPFSLTKNGVMSHPSTLASPLSPPPMEEVEPIREFKRGNRCGHNGCGKWHVDSSVVSRHRRAHVDRYPCSNPDCMVITTTYRALKRHWTNPRGRCSAYQQEREECLKKGEVNIETFDPQIHRPYKSLKLRRGKHVN